MILLTGCAAAVSKPVIVCPPVVEYDAEFLNRAADEVDSLPAQSAIEAMLADYSVMREQSRSCRMGAS